MNDMNNTTTFTAIFPDGTTETRKSKTHTYTYAVATYITAEQEVTYCEREIRRLSKYDDKASLKQVAKFPVAEHDDFVDTLTQAIIYLKNDGLLEMPRARDVDEDQKHRRKERVNPYAV